MNLHKPVTAALYHLIGPWWERHLNMQIIQKVWINFTHKCLKSLALLYKEFSISSTEAKKKKSVQSSVCEEKGTVYANDSAVSIDSHATGDQSGTRRPIHRRRRVKADGGSVVTFPTGCHFICHRMSSPRLSDRRDLTSVLSENQNSRRWQGHTQVHSA